LRLGGFALNPAAPGTNFSSQLQLYAELVADGFDSLYSLS
jgi:hypothetical protein